MRFVISVRNATKGIWSAVRSERHMRFHLVAAVVVLLVAGVLGFSPLEWSLLVAVIAVMIAFELLNTAIEALVDLVQPEHHPLAGKVKDIAAGACLIFAMGAAVIGCLLFIPRLIDLLG